MSEIDRLLDRKARDFLRHLIEQAGGNEIVARGRTDSNLVIVEFELLAQGNPHSAPMIFTKVRSSDIIVHNHPNGKLSPSDQDIAIASRLGNEKNCGFAIVDNQVSSIYVVVSPERVKVQLSIDPGPVKALYRPEGRVASTLSQYEYRKEQETMAETVVECFNFDRIALIEAGTGIGKSLAYLIPAIVFAVTNKERIVISTNTINLQEQLVEKDIPFLTNSLGYPFKTALIKGQGNYLCLMKLKIQAHGGSLHLFDSSINNLLEWAAKSESGTKSELAFSLSEEVWSEICVEMDSCTRLQCEYYQRCFYFKARRNAAASDILVVNHHLLFADLNLKRRGMEQVALLPPYVKVIFDEAHHVEEVASEYFGSEISNIGVRKLFARLIRKDKKSTGLFALIKAALDRWTTLDLETKMSLSATWETVLPERHGRYREAFDILFDRALDFIETKAVEKEGESKKLRLLDSHRADLVYQDELIGAYHELVQAGKDYRQAFEEFAELLPTADSTIREILHFPLQQCTALLKRIEGAVSEIGDTLFARAFGNVQWLEIQYQKKGVAIRFCSSPLEVGPALAIYLYDRLKGIVFTSATLCTEGNFNYFKRRHGLDKIGYDRILERIILSPFSFKEQALLAVPKDMPEPSASVYAEKLGEILVRILLSIDGGVFILFTSYALLMKVYKRVCPVFVERGHRLFRQGEQSRHRLLEQFRKSPKAVLFGTDSFWEGVDVEGQALSAVIITRLPFRVPTEPLIQARVEAITISGGDPFKTFTLPQAVLKLKQGFGRLIRRKSDFGVVVILDRRIVTRNYGKSFLESLPKADFYTGSSDDLILRIDRFYRQRDECQDQLV